MTEARQPARKRIGGVRRARRVCCLLALALAGCGGSDEEAPRPKPAPVAATVTVTDQERQTIEGWGASLGVDNPLSALGDPQGLSEDQLDELDRLLFETAGIKLMRVFVPGDLGSEGDPGPTRRDAPKFAFMRRLGDRGVRFMLSVGAAPRSLKRGERGPLIEGREGEYAEYLASVLRFAKNEIGVPFSYVAVANEPDSRALVRMSPEQAARVLAELAERVETERLGARLIPGDNVGWDTTLAYAPIELAVPSVREASAAVASHAYSGTAADMRALALEARDEGLPVWMTEWTIDPCPDCPDEARPSMRRALSWAQEITAHLTVAQATAWFALLAVADSTHGAQAGMIVRQRDNPEEPFYVTKRFHVYRHYSSAGPPGSRVLETRVRQHGIAALAFARDEGVAVVLANPGPRPVGIGLDLGQGSGRLAGRRTSTTEEFAELDPLDYEGVPLRIRLPAESVTSLELR
jgi:O-glycosyl hydrolase